MAKIGEFFTSLPTAPRFANNSPYKFVPGIEHGTISDTPHCDQIMKFGLPIGIDTGDKEQQDAGQREYDMAT